MTTTKEDADNTTKTTETSYGYETAVIHTLTGTKTYKDLQVQTTKVKGTVTDKTWTDHAGNAVRTLSNGIYTDHVFTEDGKEIAAVTLGSSTDGEGKISLTLYNKEGKREAICLAVPYLCRAIFHTSDHRILMPATFLVGASLALVCNLIARMPGFEGALPVNSVTALVGAPVVASVLFRKRKGELEE